MPEAYARSVPEDEELRRAVDAGLDDLLGAPPDDLVEEQPEPSSPEDEQAAQAHRYRSPSRFYDLG